MIIDTNILINIKIEHKHYTTNVQTKHIQTINQQANTTTKLAHSRKKKKGKTIIQKTKNVTNVPRTTRFQQQ